MDDYTQDLLDYRRRKDSHFSTADSPIPPEERSSFQGLAYFAPDPAYRVSAPIEPGSGEPVELDTSTGEPRIFSRYGTVTVGLPAGQATLALYAAPGEEAPTRLFLPFRDATSGGETYGAGRYVEVPNHDGIAVVDFNLAYHPYCAYAERWSCPLPPRENWLPFPVTAGERNR